jgi:ABC-type multidrug transport system ATPase subunit
MNPFVGLDYYNRKLLWHFLNLMKKQKHSILLTTHMLSETEQNVDYFLILKKGKIFARGNYNQIKEKIGLYYILEIKFKYLSKSNFDEIKRYIFEHKIGILDKYDNYMMFSINNSFQKSYLLKFFDSLGIDYYEQEFKQPNLDEMFLGVRD